MKPYPITLTLVLAALAVVVLNVRKSENEAESTAPRETRSVASGTPVRTRSAHQNISIRPTGNLRPSISKAPSQPEVADSQDDSEDVPVVKGYEQLTDGERTALKQRIDEAAATPDTADDREVMRQVYLLSLPVQ